MLVGSRTQRSARGRGAAGSGWAAEPALQAPRRRRPRPPGTCSRLCSSKACTAWEGKRCCSCGMGTAAPSVSARRQAGQISKARRMCSSLLRTWGASNSSSRCCSSRCSSKRCSSSSSRDGRRTLSRRRLRSGARSCGCRTSSKLSGQGAISNSRGRRMGQGSSSSSNSRFHLVCHSSSTRGRRSHLTVRHPRERHRRRCSSHCRLQLARRRHRLRGLPSCGSQCCLAPSSLLLQRRSVHVSLGRGGGRSGMWKTARSGWPAKCAALELCRATCIGWGRLSAKHVPC